MERRYLKAINFDLDTHKLQAHYCAPCPGYGDLHRHHLAGYCHLQAIPPGNDSITALNIRLSELLGISLGVQNICTNLVFLVVEFIWGRKYIGWAP